MRLTRTLTVLLTLSLLWLCACAEEDYGAKLAESADAPADYAVTQPAAESGTPAINSVALDEGRAGPPAAVDPSTIKVDARKIIYTAEISLVVDDFAGVPASVSALAKQHGGFVAGSSIRGSDGEPRRGDWTLRIPSARYDAFVNGAEALGQVRSINSDSQEVTAEYIDLEARVRNLTAEEQRLHKHLNENTRSLKDILEVEREIARVRGEAERIEGRLNVLKDLTALSTVTLSVEEIKDFVPPPTEEPGYTTQVARAWSGSIDAVGGFLTSLSLFVVGLTPWLVVIVPAGLIALIVGKRLRRSVRQTKQVRVSAGA